MTKSLIDIANTYKTNVAFCRAVGISPQFYSQLKKGIRRVPPKMVIKLQTMHGIDPSDLRPDIWPKLDKVS
jgi:DNA-binding transcriptional regulator YdaS (Cro superfamily)